MTIQKPTAPIAIVGMSCRLPGDSTDTEKLWDLLINGRTGKGQIPKSRFNLEAFYHPDSERAGTIHCSGGYFLQHDIKTFDNAFFGINNLEAEYMDPQQRQLLEVVYECFENSGSTLESMSGANIGCYVANFTSDYVLMQAKDPDLYHRYSATGFGPTILANRISHSFNLQGPSMVVDTACSSSLYALHLACAAINAGECDGAVVAAANLVQSPEVYVAMAKAGVLSKTSTSHTFDSAADGYGRGEGIAALYLKRLDYAIRDNDPIRSIVRGTAVNSNGHTQGITLPSTMGQENVIKKAYAMAGLRTDQTPYVEAHGTGTPVGDPIEVKALSNVFSHESGKPLLIGGVKPNLGHGEAVSGIASVIKATLSLERGIIPPTPGISDLNPHLCLEERHIEVVQKPTPWPSDTLRRISINSFGYGGANGHAILEAADMHVTVLDASEDTSEVTDATVPRSVVLPFSAHSSTVLRRNMDAIVSTTKLKSEMLNDLAYTLANRRSRFSFRGYMIGTALDDKIQFASTQNKLEVTKSSDLPMTFVFTGQGAQWPGMGRDLWHRFPLFRQTIHDLDVYLSQIPYGPTWSLEDVIFEETETSSIHKASHSQPVCTAIQIALTQLLRDWGVTPATVIGHSSGEIGAAFTAGYLTINEAIAVAYYRGLVASKIDTEGAMLAVGLDSVSVTDLICGLNLQDKACVACINSPGSTTVSGESTAIERIYSALEERAYFVRMLKTDGKAYHSHLMHTVGQEYEDLLSRVLSSHPSELHEPKVQMFSSVTSQRIGPDMTRRPVYWRKNLESPVLFSSALEAVCQAGKSYLVEVGPHPALHQPIRDIHEGLGIRDMTYSPTLSRGKASDICMLNLAGSLFASGFDLYFSKINSTLAPLPDMIDTYHHDALVIGSISEGDSPTLSEAADRLDNVKGGSDLHVSTNSSLSSASFRDMGSASDVDANPSIKASLPQNMAAILTERGEINRTSNPRLDFSSSNRSSRLYDSGNLKVPRVLYDLPTYTWDHREPLWSEPRASAEYRNLQHKRHDLLGVRIPATPGIMVCWRSHVKLQEVPWLQDHKLGPVTVFPAAGYVTMAIEGLSQIMEYPANSSLSLRQVSLLNLLILSPDSPDGVEISTQMEPYQLSNTTTSSIWWLFQISSHVAGSTTIHARGLIALKREMAEIKTKFEVDVDCLEQQSIRSWYNRLTKQGLCFGPYFHSMVEIRTDRARKLPIATARVKLKKNEDPTKQGESEYMIHPIIIDSLLQAAIVASSEGTLGKLDGKVPVSIEQLDILLESRSSSQQGGIVRAAARKTGFAAALLGGELENHEGRIIAQIQNVRAINYTETSLAPKSTLDRNPALRILWKPDITTLESAPPHILDEYLEQFKSSLPKDLASLKQAYLAGVIDLLMHKNGRMKILQVTNDDSHELAKILTQTSIGKAPSHFESFTKAQFTAAGELVVNVPASEQDSESEVYSQGLGSDAKFDLIVFSTANQLTSLAEVNLTKILSHLAVEGILLLSEKDAESSRLLEERFKFQLTFLSSSKVTTAMAKKNAEVTRSFNTEAPLILVHTDPCCGWESTIKSRIQGFPNTKIDMLRFQDVSEVTIPINSVVISTVELQNSILSTMDDKQHQAIKTMAANASVLLWVTGGALYKASRPEFALILGLARSLMLERPSLKMPVLDTDQSPFDFALSDQIVTILSQVLNSLTPDLEFRQRNGALYISRFVADHALNHRFREVQDAVTTSMSVSNAGCCRLNIRNLGKVETLHFQQLEPLKVPVEAGHVEVSVRAVGINAKDFYNLSDKVDTNEATHALEFSGVVTATGSGVSDFSPGDRVLVMAPNYFSTIERVPQWACVKMNNDEDFTIMSSMPLVFSTALYALENRARLEKDQSILIHSAAGGLGIAAIQIAQMIGAEVFATVGTENKRRFLVENFGILEENIFHSHDASFVPDLLQVTSGRGVDVVLNSLSGDLLHESWKVCAEFGTFIEIGKRDISDYSKLDMHAFLKSTTFTAFDLTDLYWSKSASQHQLWHGLLNRCVDLLRSGKIQVIAPLKIFSASDVVQAFRYFSLGTRIGKVAVSFQPEDQITVLPVRHYTNFSPDKAYLLVGCLGGLGRSLSRWMFKQGARHFVYIGRSGADKPSAANLVADLSAGGATVKVVRGSVVDCQTVERAVSCTRKSIGGVIQASMSINVALFNDMSTETWHAGIGQKVQGTWNLHNALRGKDSQTDFFLMLSSITGSVGTATESNYCAANSFLDSFGCYRRNLGLPAVSLGLGMISEVGFLHENPETEAVLLRKGVHPFTEEELLQVIDLALTNPPSDASSAVDDGMGANHFIQGHILTGLELHGFQRIRDQGFIRATTVLEDPRCTYIAGAFANSTDISPDGQTTDAAGSRYSRQVAKALASNESNEIPEDSLIDAVTTVVVDRIVTLLLVPADSLQKDTYLADFGMESMLAAEFRSDMYRMLKIDVPFAVLLDKKTQVKTVSKIISLGLLQSR